MTTDTDPTPGAISEAPVPAAAPLTKRKLADAEILRRRAEGATLRVIAAEAGIAVQSLSEWLRHRKQAERLKQEVALVKLERQAEIRQAEAAEKRARAEKRKAARDAKAAEPKIVVWDKGNGERYDAYVERAAPNGQHGRVGRAINWS